MTEALAHPHVRPFLPLLYVAWADGDLAPDELALLEQKVASLPWLGPDAREALAPWLDASAPPSAEALASLLARVRESAGTLDPHERRSLAALGEAMARRGADDEARDADVRDALESIEEALGLHGPEATACFFELGEEEPLPDFATEVREGALALRQLLDGHRADVRARVRALLDEPGAEPSFDLERGAYREHVKARVLALADAGLGRWAYPGVTTDEPDLEAFMVAFETLGFGDLSVWVKTGVQFGLFGGAIYFLGDDAQRARWLPEIARGERLGCFAMSELGHGSNVAALETVARYEPERDAFVVHTPSESARKEWIGNAACHGRDAVVFAQLRVGEAWHGVHAFFVPIRDDSGELMPGVRVVDNGAKMGLEGVDNGRLWFDQVEVPRENLLARYAQVDAEGRYESPIPSASRRFFTMLGTLVGGRLGVAAASVSATKVGLAVAVRYGDSRRQFGPEGRPEAPLLDYRTHQRRLLPALATTYAYHFAVDAARRRYLAADATGETKLSAGFASRPAGRRAASEASVGSWEGAPQGAADGPSKEAEGSRELETLAAGLKAAASRHAIETLQHARECCGGQGYLSENRIAMLRRDADIFATFEGDNTVLLSLVARGLLTSFRRQFQESRLLSSLRLVREAAGRAIDRSPLRARRADEGHLRDADYHRDLFAARADVLRSGVARRLQRRLGEGMDPHAAMIEVQPHLVALAEAHIDRFVLESFDEVIAGAELPDGPARHLVALRDLFALSRLEREAAWYLENGFFEGPKIRAIRKLVDALCLELRADARGLVDAFGVPDRALAAPIAFGDPARRRPRVPD
ncbi:MAG: acyl-CoA dehydrogenase family protein [Myxococcales bacterium]|nr:acyl-CoA dehydrogenase family protein [Myxococcales bacterium]